MASLTLNDQIVCCRLLVPGFPHSCCSQDRIRTYTIEQALVAFNQFRHLTKCLLENPRLCTTARTWGSFVSTYLLKIYSNALPQQNGRYFCLFERLGYPLPPFSRLKLRERTPDENRTRVSSVKGTRPSP